MNAWLAYVLAAAVAVGLAVVGASLFVPDRAVSALWIAAAIAYVVQLLAFAVLLRARGRGERAFLYSWAGGMALRFVTVVAVALWATRFYTPAAPLLLGLVGFVFVLVLLEPLFLRIAE